MSRPVRPRVTRLRLLRASRQLPSQQIWPPDRQPWERRKRRGADPPHKAKGPPDGSRQGTFVITNVSVEQPNNGRPGEMQARLVAGPAAITMTDIPRDFDWATQYEIVCRDQPMTAIYLNPFGQVVVRQQRGYLDEDSFVYFNLEHLPALIARLSAYVTPVTPDVTPVTLNGTVPHRDVTAASRQRERRRKEEKTDGLLAESR